MEKQIEFIKDLLKAMGIAITADETTVLDAAADEAALEPFRAKLKNGISTFTAKTKNAGRAEVYDEAKALFKAEFGEDLDEDFFATVSGQKGKDALKAVVTKVKEVSSSKKKADATNADVASLHQTIADLKQQLTTKDATHQSELKAANIRARLTTSLLTTGNLAEEFTDDEFVQDFLVPKLERMISSMGLSFHDSLKLVDENKAEKYDEKTNKPITVMGLFEQMAKPYLKKSDAGEFGSFMGTTQPAGASTPKNFLVAADT